MYKNYLKIPNHATALHFVAKNGSVEDVKALIENGANINAKNAYNKTPVVIAAENKNLDVVKFLFVNGAVLINKED